MPAPLIGITCSLDDRDLRVRRAYALAVEQAGGVPVLLVPPASEASKGRRSREERETGGTPIPLGLEVGADRATEFAARYLALCNAIIFTGGDDPATERYGEPTHPAAKLVHPDRQRFEEALLAALDQAREKTKPVLGICLGMQMMALHRGGALHQHLPDVLPTAPEHQNDHQHAVEPAPGAGLARGTVASWHHQAVRDAGRMRVIASAPDGVIEAIDDPARAFYLGVQWHPERTSDPKLGQELFDRLVAAARDA
jgi:putative glutamine amidotransferase